MQPIFQQMNRLMSRALRRLVRELILFKKWVRQKAVRSFYSLPIFAKRDPRCRITTFKKYCHSVEAFPNGDESAVEDWYLPLRSPR